MSKPAMFVAIFCVMASVIGFAIAEQQVIWANSQNSENITLATSPIGIGKAVKLTAPTQNWKITGVLIAGTDGWNESQEELPPSKTIALEIRDKSGKLLYHWSDTQLEYFTFTNNQSRALSYPDGTGLARIEIPSIPVSDTFYVVFYERGAVATFAELDNINGQSFAFYRDVYSFTGNLSSALRPVNANWIIGVTGE